MRIKRFYGHSVMINGLNASSTVLDLGSCYGNFAVAVAGRFHCKMFCVEPNPRLYQALASNPAVSAFNLAVTSRTGSARFYVTESPECSSLIPPTASKTIDEIECQTVTLEALLTTIAINQVDVLKVDIEGLELELLASLNAHVLDRINQLTVEFHESIGMGTTKQVLEVMSYLKGYGFVAVRGSFFDYSDVLFLHVERLELPANWRWLARAEKFRNGISRRLGGISRRLGLSAR
jgi:FkbM family methyltransferase